MYISITYDILPLKKSKLKLCFQGKLILEGKAGRKLLQGRRMDGGGKREAVVAMNMGMGLKLSL